MAQNIENIGFVPEILWHQIDYNIIVKKGVTKQILKGLSGSFKFGELTAIMGPSGSGKTTLLECIIKKRVKGVIGCIEYRCNSNPIVATITQHNYFLPEFTVKELLCYASHLKNDTKDHKSIIDDVIKQLGLETCLDYRVTKCSGGELKRLAIAQEMVSPTDILILDEPTSGLDSVSCLEVIQLLKDLSRSRSESPIAVLAVIHQPSTRVFNCFDKIYAISSDGECIYEDSPLKVVEILNEYDFKCPNNYNPADYLIEVCYDRERIVEKSQLIAEHNKKFIESNRPLSREYRPPVSRRGCFGRRQNTNEITPLLSNSNIEDYQELNTQDNRIICINLMTNVRHIRLLFQRALKSIVFNWLAIGLQLGTYITSPVCISLLYNYNIGNASGCPQMMANMTEEQRKDEIKGINDNLSFIFFSLLLFMMGGIMTTVLTFPTEMKVLMTETGNKWYKCWTYFIGRSLADCPFQMIFPIIFCIISYHMTEQIIEFWRFCLFSLLMIFVSFCAQSQGLIMGALFMDNVAAAVFIAVTSTVPVMLFGGYFIKIVSMPEWAKLLSFISYFRYTFQSMIITLYGFNRCKCDAINTTITDCHSEVLTEFKIKDNHLYKSFIWIIMYFIFIRFITYLIVKFKISKKY